MVCQKALGSRKAAHASRQIHALDPWVGGQDLAYAAGARSLAGPQRCQTHRWVRRSDSHWPRIHPDRSTYPGERQRRDKCVSAVLVDDPDAIDQRPPDPGSIDPIEQGLPTGHACRRPIVGEQMIQARQDRDDNVHGLAYLVNCSSMSRSSWEAGPVRLCWMQRL